MNKDYTYFMFKVFQKELEKLSIPIACEVISHYDTAESEQVYKRITAAIAVMLNRLYFEVNLPNKPCVSDVLNQAVRDINLENREKAKLTRELQKIGCTPAEIKEYLTAEFGESVKFKLHNTLTRLEDSLELLDKKY